MIAGIKANRYRKRDIKNNEGPINHKGEKSAVSDRSAD
jgi:hypothetical protein